MLAELSVDRLSWMLTGWPLWSGYPGHPILLSLGMLLTWMQYKSSIGLSCAKWYRREICKVGGMQYCYQSKHYSYRSSWQLAKWYRSPAYTQTGGMMEPEGYKSWVTVNIWFRPGLVWLTGGQVAAARDLDVTTQCVTSPTSHHLNGWVPNPVGSCNGSGTQWGMNGWGNGWDWFQDPVQKPWLPST